MAMMQAAGQPIITSGGNDVGPCWGCAGLRTAISRSFLPELLPQWITARSGEQGLRSTFASTTTRTKSEVPFCTNSASRVTRVLVPTQRRGLASRWMANVHLVIQPICRNRADLQAELKAADGSPSFEGSAIATAAAPAHCVMMKRWQSAPLGGRSAARRFSMWPALCLTTCSGD